MIPKVERDLRARFERAQGKRARRSRSTSATPKNFPFLSLNRRTPNASFHHPLAGSRVLNSLNDSMITRIPTPAANDAALSAELHPLLAKWLSWAIRSILTGATRDIAGNFRPENQRFALIAHWQRQDSRRLSWRVRLSLAKVS